MTAKITTEDFRAAKKKVKEAATRDSSLQHRVAIETLNARCPAANPELVADMGWQVVLSTRFMETR